MSTRMMRFSSNEFLFHCQPMRDPVMRQSIGFKRLCQAFALLVSLVLAQTKLFAVQAPAYVPPALEPWVPWVQASMPDLNCPFDARSPEQRRCLWAGTLKVSLKHGALHFQQRWQAHAPGWLLLPGGLTDADARHWPTSVKLNGQPVAVLLHEQRPAVWVMPGDHLLTGILPLANQTRYVRLPEPFPLVSWGAGQPGEQMHLDKAGRLWLSPQKPEAEKMDNPFLSFRLFRHFMDGVPVRLTSRLELEVGGAERAVRVRHLALPQTRELSLSSPLPVRWDGPDLVAQVKPGHWVITLESRFLKDPASGTDPIKVPEVIVLPAGSDGAALEATESGIRPESRLWVLSTDTNFRMLTPMGLASLDPLSTPLPKQWQRYSVFQPVSKAQWTWQVADSSARQEGREALTLRRTLWPDFEGHGLTVLDHIEGDIGGRWRLNASPAIKPGRATSREEPMVITADALGEQGVELRQSPTSLSVVSQLADRAQPLPVTGWQREFEQVHWSLLLPPSWTVLAIKGADRVTGTWWTKWRLWDVFWVVLLAAIFVRLCNVPVGILMLILLALTYGTPESLSPMLWGLTVLALLLARLAAKSLPKLKGLASVLGVLVVVFWSCLVAPNLYDGLRQIFFGPALDAVYWQESGLMNKMAKAPMLQVTPEAMSLHDSDVQLEQYAESFDRMAESRAMKTRSQAASASLEVEAQRLTQTMNKDYNAQTGPGLPQWQNRRSEVALSWSGPVADEASVQIYWLPPWASRSVIGLKLVLWILALLAVVYWLGVNVRFLSPWLGRYPLPGALKVAKTAVIVLAVLAGFVMNPLTVSRVQAEGGAMASFPDPVLLDQLQARLRQPPPCAPGCFGVESASVEMSQNQLALRFIVHAESTLYVPVPYLNADVNWPEDARTKPQAAGKNQAGSDDSPFTAVMRTAVTRQDLAPGGDRGAMILLAPGVFEVTLTGTAPNVNQFQLTFPWPVLAVGVETGQGWNVSGVTEGRLVSDTVFFERKPDHKPTKAHEAWTLPPAPPFALVRRTVEFDHNIEVRTVVQRRAPRQGAMSLTVPLLPGESVLSAGFPVENGAVVVELAAGQSSAQWRSTLAMPEHNAMTTNAMTTNAMTTNATTTKDAPKALSLAFTAPDSQSLTTEWMFTVAPQWHLTFEGLEAIAQKPDGNIRQWMPTYWPQPGERLVVSGQKLSSVPGHLMTVDWAKYRITPGVRATEAQLSLQISNSVGQTFPVGLPEGAQQVELILNDKKLPVPKAGNVLEPTLAPGKHHMSVKYSLPYGLSVLATAPPLVLPRPVANFETRIELPASRWVLWSAGPGVGPSVSFWAAVLLIVLVAPWVGRSAWIELSAPQWILLALGFSLCFWPGVVLLVLALVTLKTKPLWAMFVRSPRAYNAAQMGLILLSALVLLGFVVAVPSSLLAQPHMAIIGPFASPNHFLWYTDHLGEHFPFSYVLSVPMWCYRLVMLVWSLWLANQLIRWGQWAWQQLGQGGWFKPTEKKQVAEPKIDSAS